MEVGPSAVKPSDETTDRSILCLGNVCNKTSGWHAMTYIQGYSLKRCFLCRFSIYRLSAPGSPFFDCSVKMDLGPLNNFSFASFGGGGDCRDTAGETGFASWLQCPPDRLLPCWQLLWCAVASSTPRPATSPNTPPPWAVLE